MKNIGKYAAFALLGLLIGFIFFGNNEAEPVSEDTSNMTVNGRWTCSMHPQIEGQENGTCPLCAMDLVYMATADTLISKNQFKLSDNALALANVQTISVGQGTKADLSLKLSGTISTNTETDAIQTTLFDGRIDQLYANYIGKKVRKGQEIGLIYSPELYLAQDKLLTSISYRETHQKLYNAARNTLGLWKMTDEQIDAMLESGTPMMNFPLYADVTGTVTEVMAAEGNYYSQGTPLFKTSDLRTVWAVFDAYESDLEFLEVGQEVKLKFTAHPGESISAKISLIEPIVNSVSRTVSVRVVLNNKDNKFKPGMFVEGTINKSINADAMVSIPKSAVLWTGKRSVVYQKPFPDKPIFEMTEVLLGKRLENEYEVLDGLQPGDVIVSEGTFTIDAAAQLNGKKSMMSKGTMDDMDKIPNDSRMKLKDVPTKININAGFEKEFDGILKNYMALKDALVQTDPWLATKEAQSLLNNISSSTNNNEVQSHLQKISLSLERIINSKDVVKQRRAFKNLSEIMLFLAPSMNKLRGTVYVQHCDCVDGFTGGSWLSYDEKILNPYFGDEMLTCGRIEKTLN
ncbi:MAG: efflux RND transporter periplasmic adaptor subunit [Croceitalea sp.]|nr:efflux RND transporter periplasmic adaptor subunit [Croceitalea sp.]MBT8238048.1 efflux RND transporter periplasmic adaptor subunit [Croceitalea sp.]NNL09514.1 efflux RND transporter periplasmic adaptor subunit [Croceitalea sp.]